MAKNEGIGKIMDFLKISDPDDDFEDDLFDDDYDDEYESPKKAVREKPRKNTYDDEDDYEPAPRRAKKPSRSAGSNKLVSIGGRNNRGSSQVYVIKPQEFSEAQIVTDYLKEDKMIVINMEGLEVHAAQRIIDFIGGACYALDGSLQAISANIFIAAPNSVDVSGDLREELMNDSSVAPELGIF